MARSATWHAWHDTHLTFQASFTFMLVVNDSTTNNACSDALFTERLAHR